MENYEKLKEHYKMQFLYSSVFVFVFEILRQFVIQKVQDFFTDYEKNKKKRINPKYKHFFYPKKKIFSECNRFLVEANIINQEEATFFDTCRKTRNDFSHNLHQKMLRQFINQHSPKDCKDLIMNICNMRNLLNKISLNWLKTVECVDINPEDKVISPLVSFVDLGIQSITRRSD